MQSVKSFAFVFHFFSPFLAIFLNDFSFLKDGTPCTLIPWFPPLQVPSSSIYLINTFPGLPHLGICLYSVTHFTSFHSSTIASCPSRTTNVFVFFLKLFLLFCAHSSCSLILIVCQLSLYFTKLKLFDSSLLCIFLLVLFWNKCLCEIFHSLPVKRPKNRPEGKFYKSALFTLK